MFNFKKVQTARQKVINNEYSAVNFLPYKCHYNDNTILLTQNRLLRVIKVKGFSFETADDEDLENKKTLRNSLFKGMGSGSFSMMFHTVRRRQKAYPDGSMPNSFSQYADDEWRYRHGDKHTFINEHFVSIIRKKDESSTAMLSNIAKAIEKKADKNAWKRELQDAYGELDEMTDRMLNAYSSYGAELLGTVKTKNGPFSQILEFLGMLTNCGFKQPIYTPTAAIAKTIPNHRLFFGPKAIEARGILGGRYAGIVSLKEHRPNTHAGMLDGFLKLPFEFIISQNFNFIDRVSAISSMQLQQNRLQQSEDIAKSQVAEISEALDIAMSGEIAFGYHSLQILCIEDTVKTLENALSQAIVEFSNVGINAVREKMNLEPAYWGQLPGNDDYLVRKATINTLNLAAFASFHNFPSGKRSGNHWGNAVTVFNTTSGTPFFFNFHSRDVGHSTIIGPTGAGKTVLMNFLCAQAQKYNPRTFFFDKDRGAEIFIKAIDGVHFFLDPGHETGFNPFQLADNTDNRAFLMEWIRSLVSGQDMPALTPEDIDTIKDAVAGNYKLPQKERRLSNVAAFLGMGGPGSLASRLAMWHSDGSHAKLFDNAEDRLDFDKATSFGFEMNNILKDKDSIGPVLLYLFHKINISLDGRPTLIILDEAWALIDNDVFAPKIKDWLKVMRKLNALVVFATQSVEDAANSDISDTLIQQTATQIFLPNLKAAETYKTVFMLSEREYQIIKTTDPSSRFFLVKQGNDSVVSRIDLKGMDNVINVLSGRADTVILLDEIVEELGSRPEDWLPVFFDRVAEL
ncbi:MAG: VirB4 family type IV secretion/conjugal transfer ATPase [Alphaproteobacteria bacterium]|jgi:type IV secretion system protein VirB4|nr:VirB4 family type IV secretion/conjugal transfer ATPase [Alphaproteobacteria bacterium]